MRNINTVYMHKFHIKIDKNFQNTFDGKLDEERTSKKNLKPTCLHCENKNDTKNLVYNDAAL